MCSKKNFRDPLSGFVADFGGFAHIYDISMLFSQVFEFNLGAFRYRFYEIFKIEITDFQRSTYAHCVVDCIFIAKLIFRACRGRFGRLSS